MRFLADECCDARLVRALRESDHDVVFVCETYSGAKDAWLLSLAVDEDRIILTEDKDFGELVFRLKQPAKGIVLVLLDGENIDEKIAFTRALIYQHGDRLFGSFAVLRRESIRIRALPSA